ncbi:MAG: DUF4340 domain-containing protein [Thermoanaerobaculum sp.]|nr:DUF4340 domain-containing protein [Thermoanaerobaculum sp.]
MRVSRLLALALVVLGLFAFIWFYERKQPTTQELQERQGKLFPTLESDKVKTLVVHNSHGEFTFAKEGNSWQLVAPIKDDANQGAVSGLVSQLVNLKAERTLPAGEVKLADYGLDQPSRWLEATDEAGRRYKVQFGAEMPLGNNTPALTDGREVYLVSKWILSDLDKDLAGWRSTELMSFFTSDVNAVTVVAPRGRWAAARVGNSWQLTEPYADLADREQVDGLLADLSGARIKEFLDHGGDPGALGLESPRVTVTLVRKEGSPLTVSFGQEREKEGSKEVACRRGERLFWVDATALNHALKEPEVFRSKTLLQFSSWQVDKLELERGNQKLAVERQEAGWRGPKGEVEASSVFSRLNTLSELKVLAFDQAEPQGSPLGKVRLVGQEGLDVTATFYPAAATGELLAVVKGRPKALAVDRAKVEEVLSGVEELAKPKATPTPSKS